MSPPELSVAMQLKILNEKDSMVLKSKYVNHYFVITQICYLI